MKNRKLLSILLLIIVLIGAGTLLNLRHGKTEIAESSKLRLPIDIWPANYWIMVAEDKGFFEEAGLDVELVDVSGDYNKSVDDYANGVEELDNHNMAIFDLVSYNAKGADLVAVLASDSSQGAEGLVAKKEYTTLEDLKGKRIGVEKGSYLEYFLDITMQSANLNDGDYTKVDLVTDDTREVFDQENLDAAFLWEPSLSIVATKYDGHIIFDTSDLPGISLGVFVFRREFINTRPDDVQAFMNVWQKTYDYMNEHKAESYEIVSRVDFNDVPGSSFYSVEEVKELADLDILLSLEDNFSAFNFSTGFQSLYGNAQYVSRFIQRAEGLEKMPDPNNMITDYFIRQIPK